MATEAQRKAVAKYHEKLEDIKIRVPMGKRQMYKEQAWSKGYSLQQYIIALMEYDSVNAALPDLEHSDSLRDPDQ